MAVQVCTVKKRKVGPVLTKHTALPEDYIKFGGKHFTKEISIEVFTNINKILTKYGGHLSTQLSLL